MQWSEELQCNWLAWRVIKENHLALDMPSMNCCDMTGCIDVASGICESVSRIDTFEGGVNRTSYIKSNKEWHALDIID